MENDEDVNEKLSKSLIYVFDGFGDMTVLAQEALMAQVSEDKFRPLLDEKSLVVLIMQSYTRKAGREYLTAALSQFVTEMCQLDETKAQIDSNKIASSSWTGRTATLGNPKQARKNVIRMMKYAEQVLILLDKNLSNVPRIVRVIYRTLFDRLPVKQKSDIAANEDVIADLLFSHWVGAAISKHTEYGLTKNDSAVPDAAKPCFQWVSQILIAQAKNRFLTDKLAPLNEDLGKSRLMMMQFVRRFIDISPFDEYHTLDEAGMALTPDRFFDQQLKACSNIRKVILRNYDQALITVTRLRELTDSSAIESLQLPYRTKVS
jgi:hypothetical protein